jgi:hypothetical protein
VVEVVEADPSADDVAEAVEAVEVVEADPSADDAGDAVETETTGV